MVRQENLRQVVQIGGELLRMARQLEVCSHHSDLQISRTAFEALSAVLDEILAWLWMTALLPEASLGGLSRQIGSDDAWQRYERGQHVAAWAGIELARLCKRIKAELGSRSKHSISRFRELRFGVDLGDSRLSPNQWFCAEFESRGDYRPTGRMAVWVARKIEEVRALKERRLKWWPLTTVVHPQNETDTELPAWCRSAEMVRGTAALKQLDNLPAFGGSDPDGLEAWRKFLRHQLLTQTPAITEFQSMFPTERRKLDGVLTTTLCCAWQAIKAGNAVFFPILSGTCK
jgi:hypothetical protein